MWHNSPGGQSGHDPPERPIAQAHGRLGPARNSQDYPQRQQGNQTRFQSPHRERVQQQGPQVYHDQALPDASATQFAYHGAPATYPYNASAQMPLPPPGNIGNRFQGHLPSTQQAGMNGSAFTPSAMQAPAPDLEKPSKKRKENPVSGDTDAGPDPSAKSVPKRRKANNIILNAPQANAASGAAPAQQANSRVTKSRGCKTEVEWIPNTCPAIAGYNPIPLTFSTETEAQNFLDHVSWHAKNIGVPQTYQEKLALVMRIYNAIVDNTGFMDKLTYKRNGQVFPKKGYGNRLLNGNYPVKAIMAAAWNVALKMIELHTTGCKARGAFADPTAKKGYAYERQYTFAERTDRVVRALIDSKKLCEDVCERPNEVLRLLILAPEWALLARAKNHKGNYNRGDQIRAQQVEEAAEEDDHEDDYEDHIEDEVQEQYEVDRPDSYQQQGAMPNANFLDGATFAEDSSLLPISHIHYGQQNTADEYPRRGPMGAQDLSCGHGLDIGLSDGHLFNRQATQQHAAPVPDLSAAKNQSANGQQIIGGGPRDGQMRFPGYRAARVYPPHSRSNAGDQTMVSQAAPPAYTSHQSAPMQTAATHDVPAPFANSPMQDGFAETRFNAGNTAPNQALAAAVASLPYTTAAALGSAFFATTPGNTDPSMNNQAAERTHDVPQRMGADDYARDEFGGMFDVDQYEYDPTDEGMKAFMAGLSDQATTLNGAPTADTRPAPTPSLTPSKVGSTANMPSPQNDVTVSNASTASVSSQTTHVATPVLSNASTAATAPSAPTSADQPAEAANASANLIPNVTNDGWDQEAEDKLAAALQDTETPAEALAAQEPENLDDGFDDLFDEPEEEEEEL